MKIALLNTAVLTSPGVYEYTEEIPLDKVKWILLHSVYESFIGHKSTAEVITELTGIPVEANRGNFVQEKGQTAIVFKLNERVPEGKILTKEEIEKIGYSFRILRKLK